MRALIVSYRPRRLSMVSRPVLQVFKDCQFIFRPHGRSFGEPLAFEWLAVNSILPSLTGTMTLHRFGPFVLLHVSVTFETARDVVGRLLHESVGNRLAKDSLRYLCGALHRVITKPQTAVAAKS